MVWKIASLRCVTASISITCRSARSPSYSGNSPNGPSASRTPGSKRPSITISASAGTRKSLVRHLTTDSGRRCSAPAISSSSTSIGAMAWDASSVSGSIPTTMAASSGRPPCSAISKKHVGVARQKQHAETVGAMQLAAMDGDVLLSRARVACDHQPGRDVRAAVVLVVGGERKQPLEIHLAMDDLVRRRRSRLAPGNRITRGLLKASENLARLDPHGLGHPAAVGNQPGDDRDRMSARPRKQGGAQPIETLGDGCELEAQANARLDHHQPLA